MNTTSTYVDIRTRPPQTHELVLRIREMCTELKRTVAHTRRCVEDSRALLESVNAQLREGQLVKR